SFGALASILLMLTGFWSSQKCIRRRPYRRPWFSAGKGSTIRLAVTQISSDGASLRATRTWCRRRRLALTHSQRPPSLEWAPRRDVCPLAFWETLGVGAIASSAVLIHSRRT